MNTCKTCKWARADELYPKKGECMLNPPTVGAQTVGMGDDGRPHLGLCERRPRVQWDDYCQYHADA